MKKFLFLFAALIAVTGFLAFSPADITTIAIGDAAPKADLKMSSTQDKKVSLNEMKKANGLLVIFTCNGCPFVVGGDGSEGWEGRYKALYELANTNNMGIVLVNSNEGKRSNGDSMADMKAHAKEKGYSEITYVLDSNSELANAFGGRTTPHAFLFNKDMKLAYKGSIDDNVESAASVKQPYLRNAMNSVAKGAACDPAETKPIGCSIKRPN